MVSEKSARKEWVFLARASGSSVTWGTLKQRFRVKSIKENVFLDQIFLTGKKWNTLMLITLIKQYVKIT